MSTPFSAPARYQVLLGLGANLGNRWSNLQQAISRMAQTGGIEILARSSVYESDPVGYLDQPRFLNLVLGIESTLPPEPLLQAALGIERELGRTRSFVNAPRTLDIDILFYHGMTNYRTEKLEIPHPRYAKRAFVVVPLREVLEHSAFRTPLWAGLRTELATNPLRAGVRLWRRE